MKIISEANETVLKILAKFKNPDGDRLLHYCVKASTEDGVLLFNLMTREMVLLSEEEYENMTKLDYLRSHWFMVSENAKDKEYADLVKWILTTRQARSKAITGYTIFTTTDCNARCFYCFELGRSRIPMSTETARNVVQYIKSHCGGEPVKLSWFGGEPLFNQDVIDIICSGLSQEGVAFRSTAVSNGYLFDEATVAKAKSNWNLKRVQITLDGTEKIYNKTKAFIYRETNPYQVVLNNIGLLLEAGINVQIRLNLDLYNADDLLELVGKLADRFSGKQGLHVYAHHLFKGDVPLAESYSEEEWETRDEAMRRLNDKILQHGLASKYGISKNIRLNYCMADSGYSVTILPDGDIGLCEHFSENEFIGHIDREGFDKTVVESWKETVAEIPECAECFYYPACIRLKKCCNDNVCFRLDREEKLRKTKQQMLNEYDRWLEKAEASEDEDDGQC